MAAVDGAALARLPREPVACVELDAWGVRLHREGAARGWVSHRRGEDHAAAADAAAAAAASRARDRTIQDKVVVEAHRPLGSLGFSSLGSGGLLGRGPLRHGGDRGDRLGLRTGNEGSTGTVQEP